jgi:transcriptional regulator with XRE-family HTH domain
MNLKQFSRNLKYLRSLVGVTQEQMAAMLGLKRSAFGAWEEGRSYPNAPGLIALCNLLDIDNPRDLLARDLSAPELGEQAAWIGKVLAGLKEAKAPPQKRSKAHIKHNCASIY